MKILFCFLKVIFNNFQLLLYAIFTKNNISCSNVYHHILFKKEIVFENLLCIYSGFLPKFFTQKYSKTYISYKNNFYC